MASYVTGNLIITLILAHLIASIAAVEIRNLRASAWALCIQSLFLCSIFAAFAVVSRNATLYWWVLSTFVTKAIIPDMTSVKQIPTRAAPSRKTRDIPPQRKINRAKAKGTRNTSTVRIESVAISSPPILWLDYI